MDSPNIQISLGERFVVYRSARREDGRSVVLKMNRPDRRDPRDEELLRHEWETLGRLRFRGVAAARRLDEGPQGPVLVLEDAGQRNLADILARGPIDTARFLDLAIDMAAALAEVHRRGVLHRDVGPTNFVLGERPTLVDFSAATAVPAFTQALVPPEALDATLAYIAPEQTGRMSRRVDLRADLYALGATFYEMLTGAPPFASPDPLELLHAHVARRPAPPAVVNPGVPTALSDIVVKLLAKMPEWRYQRADALIEDLEEARRRLRATGEIATFELGRHDLPYGLVLGHTLYGREAAEADLSRAVRRVASGRAEVALVVGAPGVGKTALVEKVRGGASALWLEGKADLLGGNLPLVPFVAAVRGFALEARRDPPDRVAALGARLRAAVAPDGQVLIETFPELAPLFGADLPPLAEVGPAEAEARLARALTAFLRALASEERPLVLFLDDLQWLDAASLRLLEAVATDPTLRAVLLVGAYRDDEKAAPHALRAALSRIRAAGTPVATTELGPLDREAVLALLCETLPVEPARAAPLADAIRRKTGGNPFFIRRFLGHLYRQGLLRRDAESGQWTWELSQIEEQAAVTESVADLLAMSLGTLSALSQAVLETGACIGNEFSLSLLASVRGERVDDVAGALWAPVEEGLIVPLAGAAGLAAPGRPLVELGTTATTSYRFAHDRVQEAVYRRLGPAARKELHLRIGRWLLANIPEPALDQAIGAIADQLDRAADLLDSEERLRLARLNHRAGRLARGAAATESALASLRAGLALLPPEAWRTGPRDLWFELSRDAAECAALTGDHALCEQLASEAIARTEVALEKAALYDVLAQSSALRAAHADVIRRGREGLQLLGVELPRDGPPEEAVRAELDRVRAALHGQSDEQLRHAPPLEGAEDRARVRLLTRIAAAAWFTDPGLFRVVSCRAVDLVRRGAAPETPFAFALYGLALAMDGEYEEAYRLGGIGLELAKRTGSKAEECRALLVFAGHVVPWRAPLRRSVPLLRRALALGAESGELEYGAYACSVLTFQIWMRGAPLDDVLAEVEAALAFQRGIGRGAAVYVSPFGEAARRLKAAGPTPGACEEARQAATGLDEVLFHVLHAETCYLLGEPARALEYARKGEPWLDYLRTLCLRVDHHFYSALSLAALHATTAPAERPALVETLRAHAARLEGWARGESANFRQKHGLVAAEIARIEGRSDAASLYGEAIAQASHEGFVQDEAIGHELLALFLRARGDEAGADGHFRAAAAAYARWGAAAKVARLTAEVPAARIPRRTPAVAPRANDAQSLPALDVRVLLEAAESLSSELDIDPLVEKLLSIALEAASAERAALLLEGGGLRVRAVATAAGEVALENAPLGPDAAVPASIIDHVLRAGEALVLEDASREPRFAADPYVVRARVRSVLAVPLRKLGRTVGILYFENNLVPGAFAEDRVEVFRLLSSRMAIAIDNGLLFEERRRAEASLRLLADTSAALSESLDYDQVLARIAPLLVPALADWCLVNVLEEGQLRPAGELHIDPEKRPLVERLHREAPIPLESGLPQAQALRTRAPVVVAEVTEDGLRASARNEEHLRIVTALEPRSYVALPLLARGRGLGAITLVRCRPGLRYGPAEVALAEEVARRIAISIDNARLHRDLEDAIRRTTARDRYLRTVFRQVPGAIWATDRRLRLTYAAGNMPTLPGLDAKTLVGTTIAEFLGAPDATEPVVARHLAALAGERQSFEHPFRGRWFALTLEPLRDAEKAIVGIVGAAFDVTEPRATRERLARDEARLEEAQRVAHVGSFEWEVGPATVTWTDELHRIFGIEPGAFEGTLEAFLGRVAPADLKLARTVLFRALRERQPFTVDYGVVRPDGSVRVLHTRGAVIADAAGRALRVVGTCWDVTELTEATKARERSLSLLHATLEATADGILVISKGGKVELTNERLLAMWRLPPAPAGRPVLADEPAVVAAMVEQVEDPEAFRIGLRAVESQPDLERLDTVRLADGRVFDRYSRPQVLGGDVVGRVWSYRDVSERERLLRRATFLADATHLLESLDIAGALEALARLVVRDIGDSCAIDLFGGGAPRRVAAVSRDPGQPIAGEVHPAVLAGHTTAYRDRSILRLGVPLTRKGRVLGALTLAAPLRRRYEQADREVAEELGHRAALAIENAHLYDEAREAVRSRDEFLAVASHEIRGPVTSLHLAVQMLRRGSVPPDAQPTTLALIEREDRRLNRFVDELLELSRIRSGIFQFDLEDVDLAEVVTEVTNRLQPEFARAGSLLTVEIEQAVRGEWDRSRLDQLVTNLLSNAAKFGLGKPIRVGVSSDDGNARLTVRDEGIGIPQEARERIFRPFERGVPARHYGGLGLGLYIVKNIVEGLGGSVRVDSTPGAGSTFTVELPKARRG
jgi:PAS domain S-box-containing protein